MVCQNCGQDVKDCTWFLCYGKAVGTEAPSPVAPAANPGTALHETSAPTSTAGIAALAAAREESEALLSFLRDLGSPAPAAPAVA